MSKKVDNNGFSQGYYYILNAISDTDVYRWYPETIGMNDNEEQGPSTGQTQNVNSLDKPTDPCDPICQRAIKHWGFAIAGHLQITLFVISPNIDLWGVKL